MDMKRMGDVKIGQTIYCLPRENNRLRRSGIFCIPGTVIRLGRLYFYVDLHGREEKFYFDTGYSFDPGYHEGYIAFSSKEELESYLTVLAKRKDVEKTLRKYVNGFFSDEMILQLYDLLKKNNIV